MSAAAGEGGNVVGQLVGAVVEFCPVCQQGVVVPVVVDVGLQVVELCGEGGGLLGGWRVAGGEQCAPEVGDLVFQRAAGDGLAVGGNGGFGGAIIYYKVRARGSRILESSASGGGACGMKV